MSRSIPQRIVSHLSGNAIAYVALFAALGGTSYAAVKLKPGSVKSAAIAKGAVTHPKLAANAVSQTNIVKHSLTASVFKAGTLPSLGGGNSGGSGSGRADSGGSVVVRSAGSAAVTGVHGASTPIPLSGNTWTQGGGDLNLIAGTVTVKTPPSCTGSLGNSILVSVDGVPTTIGVASYIPANTTIKVPIAVGEVMEPGSNAAHTLSASFINSCTKDGEDFAISDAKFDVLKFN
jgi:hypothetical protein